MQLNAVIVSHWSLRWQRVCWRDLFQLAFLARQVNAAKLKRVLSEDIEMPFSELGRVFSFLVLCKGLQSSEKIETGKREGALLQST